MDISVSKISFWAILFFIFGVGLASFVLIPFYVYLPIFLLFLIFWLARANFSLKKLGPFLIILFSLTFFILGIFRYQVSRPEIDSNYLAFYNGSSVIFQGQITEEPDERFDKIKLTIGQLTLNDLNLQGNVLVNVPLYSGYQYGDLLEVECKLQEPGLIGQFDYHEYLARDNIYSTCYWPKIKILEPDQGSIIYSSILSFKHQTKDLIDFIFPEPQGSFISALTLGLKRQVPQEIRDWFALSGTAHILAISGLHISILTKLIMIFFITVLAIPRQKAFWPTLIIISLFVILAGAPASAIRAAIMGLALIYAEKVGRPHSGMRLIVLAAAVMLLINPQLLKSDIGFQLSFMAVLGLHFLGPRLNHYFAKIPDFRFLPMRAYLTATLSAQIFVLPLVLYYFGNLSLIAPLVNILILPVIPLIMLLGFLFALSGLIYLGLAKIIFWPLWILLTYVILLVKAAASIPYLSFVFSGFPFIGVIFLYLLIIFWLKKYAIKTS